MAEARVRVGVIGCGRIAGHHCRSIRMTPGVVLSAVCDLVEEKAKAYGTEFDVPYYTNYHEMLTRHPEIDVVAVITPSGMHFEHSIEILEKFKKHIVVEKPTFLKPSHLEQAYQLASSLGLQIFPVFQNRNNAAVRRVKSALENGELGALRVVSVRVRWCRPQRYYDLAPWRGTFAMDGGALTNQGIHHIDLLQYLGGEISGVSSTMATLGANIEVEDTVVSAFKFASGAVGSLEITTAARPIDFEASISLVGDKGLAQIGGIAVNELQIFTPAPNDCKEFSEDFSGCVYGHGHEFLYRDVAAFFGKGVPFPIGFAESLRTIRLLHAFYRSNEIQAWAAPVDSAESTRLGEPDEKLADLYRTPQIG